MCLPDFIEFRQIERSDSIIGFREWRSKIGSSTLRSSYIDYKWLSRIEGPHLVENENSGIYAYYYYNNNYNYYYYYNNNNYKLLGIISQWGKVAIHNLGQRSEFASIDKLFTIREDDAVGTSHFIEWIRSFNAHVKMIADQYELLTMHIQDFNEENRKL